MSEQKQYGKRDIMQIDEAGNHFSRHMLAMTVESLHSKSDIAAELAWRDAEIERLRAEVEELYQPMIDLQAALGGIAMPERCDYPLRTADAVAAINDQARALEAMRSEIEALKRGQGEPVAIVRQIVSADIDSVTVVLSRRSDTCVNAGTKLYTAAPQPAAAVDGPNHDNFPHEEMDAIALNRFRVEPSASNIFGWCVRAGDGEQELYKGRKSDCSAVARKLAGAFLDGALTASAKLNAQQAAVPEDIRRDVERYRWLRGEGFERPATVWAVLVKEGRPIVHTDLDEFIDKAMVPESPK